MLYIPLNNQGDDDPFRPEFEPLPQPEPSPKPEHQRDIRIM